MATMDEQSVPLRLQSSGLTFAAPLPIGWEQANAVTVKLNNVELLGSPLAIDAIVRVEGTSSNRPAICTAGPGVPRSRAGSGT